MKRLLPIALLLSACAPTTSSQPVQLWEGSARILLSVQRYRLTFTENPVTHDIRGTLENRTSGDSFQAEGTLLPISGGAILSAQITAGDSPKLRASILGFGIQDISLKGGALLAGTIQNDMLNGSLRINGIRYGLNMKRVW